jgi:DNA-binding beta-propeller fold protein YncE
MIAGLVLVFGLVAVPASAQFLYAVDSQVLREGGSASIRTIDRANGNTLTSVPVLVDGLPVAGIKGLAAHPTTGRLYAILKDAQVPGEGGGSEFALAMIQPDTGAATIIAVMSDRFAGLAFDNAGTLYGVTGDGAVVPETLYTIDTGTGQATFFMTLGNGTDGEAIAFNSGNGLMYHLSGWGSGPVEGEIRDIVFESIDLGTMQVTDIPLSGDEFVNGNGLAYDAAVGDFVVSTLVEFLPEGFLEPRLAAISIQGAVTDIGPTDEYFGGMAFSEYIPVELMSFSVE